MYRASFIILYLEQAETYNIYKNTRLKLLKTNAAIWFNKICKTKQLMPKYFSIKVNGNNRQNRNTIIAATIYI